jgi:ABC-type sugar transport system substrate-binding protein
MTGKGVGAQSSQKRLQIALSMPYLSPFYANMQKQTQDEATKLGNVDLLVLYSENELSHQIAHMEAMIDQKVDGVLISPIDVEAMAPVVKKVLDAKIPVVTIDRSLKGVNTLAHVGADNVKGGELQAQYILQVLSGSGNIFELQGETGASAAIDRDKGIKNIIGKQDKVKIVVDETAHFKRDVASEITTKGLATYPKPDAVVTASDDMALGALDVLKAKGIKTVIVGFDGIPEALEAINDGSMAATIDQYPGKQSREALDTIVAYIVNGTKPAQHDHYLTPVLITKDNLTEAERIGETDIPVATEVATESATATP